VLCWQRQQMRSMQSTRVPSLGRFKSESIALLHRINWTRNLMCCQRIAALCQWWSGWNKLCTRYE
jgi:hypothetical protein